jgi:mannose-6-phosphate isomerase-like protein (cupin superfamily)
LGLFLPFVSALTPAPGAEADDPEAHPTLEVVVLSEQPWYEAEDRAVAREIASPRNSKLEQMSIAEIKIPAGVSVVPHHHEMEEVYYIVAGEGTMMVEDETRIVRAGESVVLAPHQWHNITNHTDEELRMIVVCAPSWAPEKLQFDRSTIPVD